MPEIKITNPCKAWWPGDKRVERYIIGVIDVLKKHNVSQPARTEIYNRAYEAVYSAIKDMDKRNEEFIVVTNETGMGVINLKSLRNLRVTAEETENAKDISRN